MKNKLKIAVVIAIIAILLIIGGVVIYFSSNSNNSEENKPNTERATLEEMRNYVETLNNTIIHGGNEDVLKKVLHTTEIDETSIMTGKDAYLLKTPSEEIIEEYSLNQYVNTANTLAQNLETRIVENFEYTITDVGETDDYTSFHITYRTFYYDAYINDLLTIRNELLTRAGYDLDNVVNNAQFIADLYKAKVKAAYLLNNYLDNYVNQDETANTVLSFTNNRIEDSSDEFISYLHNLNGGNYSKSAILTTEEEINAFLNNFDLTDPLAL